MKKIMIIFCEIRLLLSAGVFQGTRTEIKNYIDNVSILKKILIRAIKRSWISNISRIKLVRLARNKQKNNFFINQVFDWSFICYVKPLKILNIGDAMLATFGHEVGLVHNKVVHGKVTYLSFFFLFFFFLST